MRGNDNPFASVTDVEVGDIVRIKQIRGTRRASKRQPIWAVVREVDRRVHIARVYMLYSEADTAKRLITEAKQSGQRRSTEYRINVPFENLMPAPKRIPSEVTVALVKDRLNRAAGLT